VGPPPLESSVLWYGSGTPPLFGSAKARRRLAVGPWRSHPPRVGTEVGVEASVLLNDSDKAGSCGFPSPGVVVVVAFGPLEEELAPVADGFEMLRTQARRPGSTRPRENVRGESTPQVHRAPTYVETQGLS